MKISKNWLTDFLKTDTKTEKLAEILTDIGLEIEGTEQVGLFAADLDNFVVGKVIVCDKHPNADSLSLTQVEVGAEEPVQIVCGAPNVRKGLTVAVALPGAEIKDEKGNGFKIKKAKLRGEASHGMICSQKELRISDENAGIWEMDETLKAGTPLAEVVELYNDTVYEIGLTPNRADAMSHYGVARDAFAALKSRKFNAEFVDLELEPLKESKEKSPVSVSVEEEELCPRYSGIYLENIEVKTSPLWLQRRLQSIGLSPINNVVDATNYVLHALGQPMHAFDADRLEGQQIVVKKSVKGQKFTTLDNVERELNGEELMIWDEKQAIGMAGVMGGLDSSVTDKTQNIFLESAYFNPVSVRKTAKFHSINSDSSFRFERGIDPNFCINSLVFAAQLIQKIAGGKIKGNRVDLYPQPLENFKINLHYRKIDSLLGERIHRQKIKEILGLLSIEITSEADTYLEVEVPSYRVDVQREVDLIEEILRIYGYNNIHSQDKITSSIVAGEGFLTDKINNTLAEMLVTKGYSEAMNISMYNEKYDQILGFDAEQSVTLLNSLSRDLSVMRRSLLPGLLENIDFNVKRKRENIKLFEFGHSYTQNENAYHSKKTLALVLSGKMTSEHWQVAQEPVNMFALKGMIEMLLNRFKIKNTKIKTVDNHPFGQAINYQLKKKDLASLVEIKPELLKKFDIKQAVFYAEINLETLYAYFDANKGTQLNSIPKFPAVRRDLALLIDKETSYQEIENLITNANQKYVKTVNLFDVYEGDKLPSGKKSYAVSISLQDEKQTMTDKQIDKIMAKIINTLQSKLNAELRN